MKILEQVALRRGLPSVRGVVESKHRLGLIRAVSPGLEDIRTTILIKQKARSMRQRPVDLCDFLFR